MTPFSRTLITLGLLCLPLMAGAGDWPLTRDLQQAARYAEASDKVLVVYVTMEGCPYCHKLEADLLDAAWREGELDAAHFVELAWDFDSIVNFSGEPEIAADFMKRYGLVVTPTMLFLGPDGEELADRVIGYKSEDFYWQYFLAAMNTALEWVD